MLSNRKHIYVRSPLRVSFAGGGTDLEDYFLGNVGHVVSTTIPFFVYVTIKDMFDANVRVHHSVIETESIASRIKHNYIRTALERFGLFRGVEVVMTSDVMTTGSGLGASSAAMSALTMASRAYREKGISDKKKFTELVCALENESGAVGGKQDQYATVYGGFNSITFKEKDISVEPVKASREVLREFEKRSFLIYTNLARSSDIIQTGLKENIVNKKANRQLDAILSLSYDFQKIIESEHPDFDDLGRIMDEIWMMKQGSNKAATNPYIAQLYSELKQKGVIGGKILGAGGGGFFFAYAKNEKIKNKILYELYPNYIGTDLNFWNKGTEILWKNF